MNKCCEDTFKKALLEVLHTIRVRKPNTVEHVIKLLEYSILLLEENNK